MNLEPHYEHKTLRIFYSVRRAPLLAISAPKDCFFWYVPFMFLLTLFPSPCVFSSLFALLSKKHNKVLEQATQSLRGRQGDNAALPDYVSNTYGLFFLSLNNV